MTIDPHGGKLTARLATPDRAAALTKEAATLPRVNLTPKQSCDLELLSNGGYSPLAGFMGEKDFRSVCQSMTLADGNVWSIPVLLSVDRAAAPKVGSRIALYAPNGVLQGVMSVTEVFAHDKKLEIPNVFRTEDPAHPGVAQVLAEGGHVRRRPVEGVTLCVDPAGPEAFLNQRLTPAQTRAAFAERGWKSIVAFQTRNPIHRAHEYVCKCAQELCDGLLIHPLVGETKKGDIPADVRMVSIDALVSKYFNPAATMVSVLPAAMRYAGPREAIHHAVMRKNYGVTHFIVGTRPRGRRQLLRHLRRPEDLRPDRRQEPRPHHPQVRAHRVFQVLRRDGQPEDLPEDRGGTSSTSAAPPCATCSRAGSARRWSSPGPEVADVLIKWAKSQTSS